VTIEDDAQEHADQQLDLGDWSVGVSASSCSDGIGYAGRSAQEATSMCKSPLNIVAVSNDALRPELLDMLLAEDSSYDVIVIESIARAYSRIRQLQPAFVVLFMDIEDEDACRLLSTLQNERALRGLSVRLCAGDRDRTATHRLGAVEGRFENLAEYFGPAL
jgi:hypothetical protein